MCLLPKSIDTRNLITDRKSVNLGKQLPIIENIGI